MVNPSPAPPINSLPSFPSPPSNQFPSFPSFPSGPAPPFSSPTGSFPPFPSGPAPPSFSSNGNPPYASSNPFSTTAPPYNSGPSPLSHSGHLSAASHLFLPTASNAPTMTLDALAPPMMPSGPPQHRIKPAAEMTKEEYPYLLLYVKCI